MKTRRIIAFLLIFSLCVSLFPVFVLATDELFEVRLAANGDLIPPQKISGKGDYADGANAVYKVSVDTKVESIFFSINDLEYTFMLGGNDPEGNNPIQAPRTPTALALDTTTMITPSEWLEDYSDSFDYFAYFCLNDDGDVYFIILFEVSKTDPPFELSLTQDGLPLLVTSPQGAGEFSDGYTIFKVSIPVQVNSLYFSAVENRYTRLFPPDAESFIPVPTSDSVFYRKRQINRRIEGSLQV